MPSFLVRTAAPATAAACLLAGCTVGDTPAPERTRAASVARTPAATAAAPASRPIDFNAHIRPILNQNCTSCHGGVKSAGEVSFVYRDVVGKIGKKSGQPVIVPGQPEASELIRRVTSPDKEYRMPPADHGPALPAEKVALLREWIRQGAPWQDHWAFVAPKPPAVPVLADAPARGPAETRLSPVDAFIRARLAQENLAPAPEASRAALLRRLSLDLIGLPPTPEETAAFLADPSPGAYEKQVDRLLASPHFGERWASLWLDLARYADTKGYEKDENRTVWPYRDWLIRAFNRNLPYDQFVVEQLAGDLLPGATPDQLIASSFHRLTQVNDEGGTDDEEYRIAAVVDRVATTWQVTGAVTFNCVQCHAHPYDPIRQQEYYRFYSFFNTTRDADFREEYPTLRVATDPARQADVTRLRREIDALRHDVISAGRNLERDARQWRPLPLTAARALPEANVTVQAGALVAEGTIAAGVRYELTAPVPALSLDPITALRLEVPPIEPEKARHTPERGFIVSQLELALALPDGTVQPLAVGRYFPDTENLNTVTTRPVAKPAASPAPAARIAGAEDAGSDLRPDGAAVEAAPSAPGADAPSAPGARKARPAAAATAGAGQPNPAKPKAPRPEMRDITLDFHFAANPTLDRTRWVVAALREPLVAPPGATLRISVVHGRQITEKPAPVRRLRLTASSAARWSELARDPEIARKAERVTAAIAELQKIPGSELPIARELPENERRETRLFVRGSFLEKTGEPLAPGVPALFPPLPANAPADRLTLARWFFQPGQPLTARVTVNRFWEQLFGTGLVATLEDFGSVGDPPSHPELLDWLALRFERDLRWDLKALLRELVTTATYRQDARATPESLEKDPKNRLLARGPRQRLTAEMVRDQALAASGLLSRKLGGPPVMPPQPPGVWQTVYNSMDWVESKGEDRYRRAVYTFWKRSAAYPGFLTFDLPPRDLCTARRTTTNTPLQALVTLNDVVYQEAARALAARVQQEIAGEGDAATDRRIARAFALVVSRPPTATETARLRKLHAEILAAPAAPAPPAAGAEQPTSEAEPSHPAEPSERALTAVAAAILNLDAAFVR